MAYIGQEPTTTLPCYWRDDKSAIEAKRAEIKKKYPKP